MNYSFGIMEGRLTPSKGRGIQFFPFDNWKQEFYIAKEIGIDEIEFIFDYDNYESNPIWIGKGESVGEIVKDSGTKVNSLCFDYFMRRPFYKYESSEKKVIREENKYILKHVLDNMYDQGINLIEIPLVDNSSIKNKNEQEEFVDFISGIINDTPTNIRFGFETDFPPKKFVDFLDFFDSSRVGANYDTGNSSGIGYDPETEMKAYGKRVFNIHIKDRKFGGTTQRLGTGSADFESFFCALSECNYEGSFILQAARTDDGTEKENIMEQVEFVKNYIYRYL